MEYKQMLLDEIVVMRQDEIKAETVKKDKAEKVKLNPKLNKVDDDEEVVDEKIIKQKESNPYFDVNPEDELREFIR